MRKLLVIIPILFICFFFNKQADAQKRIETLRKNTITTINQAEGFNKKITPELFYIKDSVNDDLLPNNESITLLSELGFKRTDSARINFSWEFDSPSLMCDCMVYELNNYKITAFRLLFNENLNENPVRYEICFPTLKEKEEFIERGREFGLNREDVDFEGYYFYGNNGTFMAEMNDTVFIGFFH